MGDDREILAYRSLLASRADESVEHEVLAARRILHSIPTPVFVKDKQSRFVACNQSFGEYAGIDPNSILGLTDDDMPWRRLTGGSHVDWDRRVLSSGMTATQIEEPIQTADGAIRWLETNKVPLRDQHGSIIGLVGSFWDITKRRQLQAEMRQIGSEVSATTDFENLKLVVCAAVRKLVRVDLTALLSVSAGGEFTLAHIDVSPGYDTSIDSEMGLDLDWLSELLKPGTLNGATCSSGLGNHIGPASSTLACAIVVEGKTAGILLVESRSLNLLGPQAASRLEGIATLAASKFEALQKSNDASRAAALSERERIGEELHDTAIQALSSAALLTSAATSRVDPNDPILGLLQKIQVAVDTSQGALRSLVLDPVASTSHDEPFIGQLEQVISKFSVRSSVSVVARLESLTLTPDETIAFKRIAEEALNNVYRHADAKNVAITVSADPSPVLTISDDGKGFDPSAGALGHFGLAIMQSRAEKVGATMSVDSRPGTGTTITVARGAPSGQLASLSVRRSARASTKLSASSGSSSISPRKGPFWWLVGTVLGVLACYGVAVVQSRAEAREAQATELVRQAQVARERSLLVRAQLDELTLALAAPLGNGENGEIADVEAANTRKLKSSMKRLEELAGGNGQAANEARLLLDILESASDALEEPRSAEVLYGLAEDLQFSGVAPPGQALTELESITATLWLDQSVTFIAEESLMAHSNPDVLSATDLRSALVNDFISDALSFIESSGGWFGPDPARPLVNGVMDLQAPMAHEEDTVAAMNELLAGTQFWAQDQWIRQWPSDDESPLAAPEELLRAEQSVVSEMRLIADNRLDEFLATSQSQGTSSRRLRVGLTVALVQMILVVAFVAFRAALEVVRRLRELRIASRTDHLTGAWNRKALDTLASELATQPQECHALVVSTDMDRFKMVNASYGHGFGDHVLRVVASNLQDLQNLEIGHTTVVRLGGDEFMVAVQSDRQIDLAVLRGALDELRGSLVCAPDGTLVALGFSYGVASASGPCQLEDLLNISDLGAYEDKAARLQALVQDLTDSELEVQHRNPGHTPHLMSRITATTEP